MYIGHEEKTVTLFLSISLIIYKYIYMYIYSIIMYTLISQTKIILHRKLY